ncbi:MAG TPA: phosphoribosyltransferase [Thermoproteota archaeon]|nr:phosphoribosyltransferase [Thermoproteota archaeon]
MVENRPYDLVDWAGFYHLCLELVDRVLTSGKKFDVIVGISRGGLVPARILSDELENPNVVIVRVEYYTDIYKVRPEPRVVQVPDLELAGKDVLLVDDVADSGRSLESVSKLLKHEGAKSLSIATVFYKPWSLVVPDFYVRTTDRWIVFPHEQREAILAISKKMGDATPDAVRQQLIDIGFEPSVIDRALGRKKV